MYIESTNVRSMSPTPRRIFIIHGSHYLTDHAFHGDGLVAWGFINELANRGHDIHVLTDHLDVKVTPPNNLKLVEFKRTHKSGILHYLAYMIFARSYYYRLRKVGRVDVVHQMNPVVRGISLALLGARTPIVLGTFVGDWASARLMPEYASPSLKARVTNFFKSSIDAVQQMAVKKLILATPHALSRIPMKHLLRRRIEYVHHGVDTKLFSPEPRSGDPDKRPQSIIFVGSFHRQKGALDLVEAFAEVIRAVPEARLILVGNRGDALTLLREKIVELGLADSTEFTGRASRSEVSGWMRASTLLCAPSYGEPYGQNVLEAMASGKPVVISNKGGHKFLSNEIGKAEFEPGDIHGLATALIAVLSSAERSQRMGAENRRLAEEIHSWPQVTNALESVYERAIASKKSIPRNVRE